MKAEPGWYVRITLPHGEQIHIDEFIAEAKHALGLRTNQPLGSRSTGEADMPKTAFLVFASRMRLNQLQLPTKP